MGRKLYAVALFAVKLDPAQTLTSVRDYGFSTKGFSDPGATENNFDMDFQMVAGSELATSEDEVLELALARAKEMWPESEGYVAHRAYWAEIPGEQILLAAASIEGGMLSDESGDSVM